MKRILLFLSLTVGLVICMSCAVMADPGFHIGLGYNQLDNDLAIKLPSLGTVVDLHTPCRTYTLDLGYDFSDYLAINAQYNWGTTNLVGLLNNQIKIDEDNTSWQIEAPIKWAIGQKTKLGLVVGYADIDTKGKLTILGSGGDLKQSLRGFYVGPILTVNPSDRFEFGLAYRWMVNPDGEIKASIAGNQIGPNIDLNDLSHSNLDLYAKAAITKDWAIKTGYTYSWTDYKINNFSPYSVDVSSKTSGLYAIVQFKF